MKLDVAKFTVHLSSTKRTHIQTFFFFLLLFEKKNTLHHTFTDSTSWKPTSSKCSLKIPVLVLWRMKLRIEKYSGRLQGICLHLRKIVWRYFYVLRDFMNWNNISSKIYNYNSYCISYKIYPNISYGNSQLFLTKPLIRRREKDKAQTRLRLYYSWNLISYGHTDNFNHSVIMQWIP